MLAKDEMEEKNRKIKQFLDAYLEKYPICKQETIKYGVLTDTYFTCRTTTLMQIYTYLDIIPKDINYYYGLFELLQKLHNLSGNVLEVAGGNLPVFGNIISNYQTEISSGTLTIIDHELILDKFGTATLIKREYKKEDDIAKYDLVTAIRPCEATIPVIKGAAEYKKDLFLATCGCEHYERYSDKDEDISWENYLYHLIKSCFDSDFLVEEHKLETKYRYPNLIFSIKHKRNKK